MFDDNTSFLYGQLEEPVFMKIPQGYKEESKISKLKKSWTQKGSIEMESMPNKVPQDKRTNPAQNRTMHVQGCQI